jgi:hypothetical protein
MSEQYGKFSVKLYTAVGAVLGWLALILQLYLSLENTKVSVAESLLRYFSYFTILTNLLAALAFTAVWLNWQNGLSRWLRSSNALSAVTVYIFIVGVVYNAILRALWEPQGLQRPVDEYLHTVQPLYFLLFWLLYVPKKDIKWKYAITWLCYPALYIVYLLLLGMLTQFYPYPFADVGKLGYVTALLNGLAIISGFFIAALVLIAASRIMKNQPQSNVSR